MISFQKWFPENVQYIKKGKAFGKGRLLLVFERCGPKFPCYWWEGWVKKFFPKGMRLPMETP